MIRSFAVVAVMATSLVVSSGDANAQTAMFDYGSAGGNDLHQAGWTIYELGSNPGAPVTSIADPSTGWTTTFIPPAGSSVIAGGRDRDPYSVPIGGTFTLDDVYIDFIVGWEDFSINNLDPSATYDVQLIMFDDNVGDGRRQAVTNITNGASDFLGLSEGPGMGAGNGSLMSNLDYSIFATGVSPDASGDLVFRFSNTATTNRSIINGVIITQTSVVPEPTSFAAVLLGLAGYITSVSRRRIR